jgi:transposase
MTGYDRKTIKRYLAGPGVRPVYGPRARAESKLEPFKAYLKERLQEVITPDDFPPALTLGSS